MRLHEAEPGEPAARLPRGMCWCVASRCEVESRFCAAAISAGTELSSGWPTAVLSSTIPARMVVVALGPSERDGAAPVVSDGQHRAGDSQHLGQRLQLVDPVVRAGGSIRFARRTPYRAGRARSLATSATAPKSTDRNVYDQVGLP